MCARVARLEPDHLTETSRSLLEQAAGGEGCPQIVMGLGIVGTQTDRFAEAYERLVPPAVGRERHPKVVMRLGIIRFQA